MIRSNALRQSAKGQACTMNVPGACNHNPETVVLAHLPDESKGTGLKADDISTCFCCSGCHDWLDGRTHLPQVTRMDRDFFMRRAMIRTWRKWIEMGLVRIG